MPASSSTTRMRHLKTGVANLGARGSEVHRFHCRPPQVHHIAATTGFILLLAGGTQMRWKKRIRARTYRESDWFASQNHARPRRATDCTDI